PMSWTSPLTVASTIVPRVADAAFSMNCSRCATAAFMASADCRTSATMSWLSLNSRPTSSMPRIRGPLTMSSGAASWSFAFRAAAGPPAAALTGGGARRRAGGGAGGGGRLRRPPRKRGGGGGPGSPPPPVDEVLGQPPLLLRNGRVALQTFGVHDRVVEACLG